MIEDFSGRRAMMHFLQLGGESPAGKSLALNVDTPTFQHVNQAILHTLNSSSCMVQLNTDLYRDPQVMSGGRSELQYTPIRGSATVNSGDLHVAGTYTFVCMVLCAYMSAQHAQYLSC